MDLPGPGSPASLQIWNNNISAWTAHGIALLDKAQAAGVKLLTVQEVNLPSNH